MNTPTHVAASLLVWRKQPGWPAAAMVGLGAVIPDAPMFGFYFYQKVGAGRTEHEIWSSLYFDESWQFFFDLFNSIPLMAALMSIFHVCGLRLGTLLAASALLHLCCDLPVHHDDAHRHFLPFSDWRFYSPISYWDPKHFGALFMRCEVLLGTVSASYVVWTGKEFPMRMLALATLTTYILGIACAFYVWAPS